MKKLLVLYVVLGIIVSCSSRDDTVSAGDGDDTNKVIVVPDISSKQNQLDSMKALYKVWKSDFESKNDTDNMLFVKAKGISYLRGDTNLININNRSINQNIVEFTYDWYIDKQEVTQKEYYVYLGKPDKLPPSYNYWKDMDKPVGYISFINAVLYCNAKSKFYGLDTVYSYVKNGATYSSIKADFTKNGYSLPLPAEWEYIAKEIVAKGSDYTDPKYSNYGQTGGSPVKYSSVASTSGLFNFFGNMAEYCWGIEESYVKDAKYVDPGLYDFEINSNSKIVAMGGNLVSQKSDLNPSLRTFLTIDFSSKTEYYGIRTVLRVGVTSAVNKNVDVERLYGYNMGVVSGRVVDSLGAGLSDVNVFYNDDVVAKTGENGSFITDSIPNKEQVLLFSKDGFYDKRDTVFVLGDSIVTVGNIVLIKIPEIDTTLLDTTTTDTAILDSNFTLLLDDEKGLDLDNDSYILWGPGADLRFTTIFGDTNRLEPMGKMSKYNPDLYDFAFDSLLTSVVPNVGDTFYVETDSSKIVSFEIESVSDSLTIIKKIK